MGLFWRQTQFAWIASKTPFQDTNRFVIEDDGDPPDNIRALTMQLFEHDGESVCIRLPEPDMESILKGGKLFPVEGLQLSQGEEGECHSNCSTIWLQNKKRFSICTGYGLTEDDQMWRQHTWLLEKQDRTLLETTTVREKYYGIELSLFKTFLFAMMNK